MKQLLLHPDSLPPDTNASRYAFCTIIAFLREYWKRLVNMPANAVDSDQTLCYMQNIDFCPKKNYFK